MELARKKLGNDPRVRYIEADVFTWEPEDSYDVVSTWGGASLRPVPIRSEDQTSGHEVDTL